MIFHIVIIRMSLGGVFFYVSAIFTVNCIFFFVKLTLLLRGDEVSTVLSFIRLLLVINLLVLGFHFIHLSLGYLAIGSLVIGAVPLFVQALIHLILPGMILHMIRVVFLVCGNGHTRPQQKSCGNKSQNNECFVNH